MTRTAHVELLALASEIKMAADRIAEKVASLDAPGEPIAMLGGIHGVSLIRHIKCMADEVQRQFHTPLYEHPPAPVNTMQARAVTLEELTALGMVRGYRDPLAWAKHVLAGREGRQHK